MFYKDPLQLYRPGYTSLQSTSTFPGRSATKNVGRSAENLTTLDIENDRSYQDFERYLEKFPDTNVVELDVVEGAGGKSEQVLLTMLFRNCSLMLIFLMEADRKDNVQDVFQRIYTHLGAELYRKLFPVILTDNGASFKDPAIFERPEGELLSRVFYCDPMASWQKGRLEKNS